MLINLLPFAFSGDESVASKTLLQSVASGRQINMHRVWATAEIDENKSTICILISTLPFAADELKDC